MNFFRTLSVVAALTCALLLLPHVAASQEGTDSHTKLKDGFDVNAMDKSVDPCVDFYRYACGTWLKQNPVPSDKAVYGRSSELADRNREILRDVLEKASTAGADRSANEQKTGDYYASCMDEAAIESKGIAVLRPELDRITGLSEQGRPPRSARPFQSARIQRILRLWLGTGCQGFDTTDCSRGARRSRAA